MSTYTPKAGEIQRSWHVVDAEGLVLGRLASEVAKILRGKHKPTFTPHQDTGDHVVIVNADKVVLTGAKAADKTVYRHSGYPGGLRSRAYGSLLHERPEETLRKTIGGMLPRNRLGRQMLSKLKVYRGPDHPHQAQRPQPLALEHTRSRGPRPLYRANEERRISPNLSSPKSEILTADLRSVAVGSIQELGVSGRLEASLRNAGIDTIQDLISHTSDDVLSFSGVGPKSFDELVAALARRDLSLRIED